MPELLDEAPSCLRHTLGLLQHRFDDPLHLLGQAPVLLGPEGDLLGHLPVLLGPVRHQLGEALLLLEQPSQRAGDRLGDPGNPLGQLRQGTGEERRRGVCADGLMGAL